MQPSWWVCHDWKLQLNLLLFADDLVLLSSTESGLQCALNSFADASNTTGMKISRAKTEVLHLSREPDQCLLQVNGATVKQVEKFKYLRVAFTSAGRQDEALVTRIGKASAVMRALHYSVVMKRELLKKAKLSVFKTVFVPILTYGHKSWVMIEKVQSQVHVSKMRFLQTIEGVTLFDKVRISEIRKSLNIAPLLFRIERSQLRWFGHVSRMPQERLPNKLYMPKQMEVDHLDDLEPDGPITLRILDGIAWGFTQAKWWMWWKTVRCGGSISNCCFRNPHVKAGNEEKERKWLLFDAKHCFSYIYCNLRKKCYHVRC